VTEHGPVEQLEQRCVIRGWYWVIEGYDVKRRKGRQASQWGTGEWQVFFDTSEPPVTILRTLDDVREWIRDQR
jgi:hypothetical protein